VGKAIGLAILLILGVIVSFPELKDAFDRFNAPTGALGSLPAETTFLTFFWTAFPFLMPLIIVIIAVVMIVVRSRREG